MKNKEPKMKYGTKPSDFYKNTSFNFLENEKQHCVLEKINVDDVSSSKNRRSVEKLSASEPNARSRTQSKVMGEEIFVTKEHTVQGTFAPKRYVSTCYFQPKQVPVRYSETMILDVATKKKRYFDSIYTKNVLIPSHWTESMTTILPGTKEPFIFQSDVLHPVKNEFHYISLENQQLKALNGRKEDLTDNINYV